ncbi:MULTISPECIES: AraC family transcriptional regulator [unclassified Cellulophaga]|uniref:AraC family transcriptional regulator n=1 Tax=unclassified Cellulophaga TaxID=2634405 RepID=UPI0026E335DF|nr:MULTISPECIES: AraC family transcriptional regulator [unclassified Cellulophaga]MDO6492674.1 AraC family transcriptional regulator [Cellulophaga sp. 2_MG-2023]MDO6495931.1 AraC family transcriptional regulator [Cellulophaga sp. 3_MG-2023]
MIEILQSLRLTLLNTGYAKLGTSWDFDNVISPFTRMYYITKGTARVYHNDNVYHLKPGYMYLIPSFTYARYICDDYHEQYYISFLEEINSGLSIYNFKNFEYEIKASEQGLYYFKRLTILNANREIKNSDPKTYDNRPTLQDFIKQNENLSTQEFLETQGILTTLLSNFITNKKLPKEINLSNSNLNQILNYINKNLHLPITIEELANTCHYSTDYFSKLFLNTYGLRPNKYIQSKRIERAQLLLLTTKDSLEEIAQKVGFENVSYFSRSFKKHTEKTPASFRKEQVNI